LKAAPRPRQPRLYRPKRTAARIALYTSLVVTVAFAAIFVAASRSIDTGPVDLGWKLQDYARIEAVSLLQDYLRIDTTPQTGSELAGAEYLASVLARDGIASEVIDMGRRKANLIAILPGESDQALVLHNHIDVDPIREPEKWKYPPFSGTIDLPWIYGRGAFDMKSVAIAELLAMVELKRSGVRPRHTVIFLATSGEETGSVSGTAWLLRERRDLLAKSWGVLTEGGVVEARSPEDVKYWGTENAQKRFVRVLACSRSRERLQALVADLADRGQPLEPLRVTPPVAEFLSFYASTRDLPLHRELLSRPESTVIDLQKFEQLAPYEQGFFRDEVSPLPIERAPGGQGWMMQLTLGLLPDIEVDAAMDRLLPEWITHGVSLVRLPDDGPAPVSPIDHPIFVAIGETIEARYGKVPHGPFYQTRSTNDARLFRSFGVPSYGFSPFLVLTTDTVGIGGTNEGIALPAYLDGVATYGDLVRRLVGAT
jgi:acetylornithine deacetylase/succinyl-diaminopimelate desuccinylase-like protein